MINFTSHFGPGVGMPVWLAALIPFLPLIILWSLFWKGLALWHSARRGQHWWFVVFLLVNSLGILEIVYLFGIIKLKASKLFGK